MATPGTHVRWYDRDYVPGAILLAATALSFLLTNAPTREGFEALLHADLLAPLSAPTHFSLHHFINDALMAVFFLYVGLELKRECIDGPFANPREAALPMIAALGGMAAPALIYLAIAAPVDPAFARGWAIPAATDIAFALGVLSLLGPRVPKGLRLFLLALAIIDDLGAILVIALFYSTNLTGWALGGAALCFILMLLMNRAGVTKLSRFWPVALALWGFMFLSGIHATIAGVLAALAIPMRNKQGASPLEAAEHTLKPWVSFAIMPVFALANAGVHLGEGFSDLLHPVALACAAGLVLGKPLGIAGATFLASWALKAPLPCRPLNMVGVSMVAGIGFTMSLFIGGLAFGAGDLAAPVRLGVLSGSIISALLGLAVLTWSLRRSAADAGDPTLAREEEAAQRDGVIGG